MTGKELRRLRKKRRWSQDRLAKLAGVSASTVGSAEAGKRIRPELWACIVSKLTGAPVSAEGAPASRMKGFAAMSAAARSRIASMGGRAAHEQGKAHVFTTDEAREAGRKGGAVVSADREYMSKIGALGGARRVARLNGGQQLGEAREGPGRE